MVFSDTTNKNGLIQECEFWTKLGDGAISGNSLLLAQFTSRINLAYDTIMPILFAYLKTMGWDDTNNTDFPVSTFNINQNQNDYTFLEDADGLDILTITNVAIIPGAGSTDFVMLKRLTMDDPGAPLLQSPNSDMTGIPTEVLIKGNSIFFNMIPNYSYTNGGKIYFKRDHERFVTTDTTKEPGIPIPFHSLLALHASKEWLAVNKPANTVLIETLDGAILKRENQLESFIMSESPTTARMAPGMDSNR